MRIAEWSQKLRRKRRSAVEPNIGHVKSDNRLGRCLLKRLTGDAKKVILAAAGSNLQKLPRAIIRALMNWLLAALHNCTSGTHPG
jgi:IS5 family transposase